MRVAARRKVPAVRVNGSLPGGTRHNVHRFVVNKGAPDLFPVMSLVKKEFTRREMEERRAFGWGGAICYNLLKRLDILSLTNYPLN